MTVISLAPSSAGCRFSSWCNDCDDAGIRGERNHWSGSRQFYDAELEDFVGVELYGYENDRDGIDPVQVYLAGGRDGDELGGRPIPAEKALALGQAILAFRGKSDSRDSLVHSVEVDGELVVSAEFRAARRRRNGTVRTPRMELSVHGAEDYAFRLQLAMGRLRDLGLHLVNQAQLAIDANRFLGLLGKNHVSAVAA